MSETVDDRELVERTCQGDRAAFEAIFRRYGDKVYGLAARLTLDPSLAEDLTQEAFIRIWEKIGSFRFESAFSTWVYRVATNVVLADSRRGKGMKLVALEDNVEVTEPEDPGSGVRRLEIEQQLARLPERARVILVLHDLAGLTHEEIAETLSIAAGTSKAQLFRARKLYRDMEAGHGTD